MQDQIENHWCGDNEDCEDAGLHARMASILNTHEFKITCNRVSNQVARVQSLSGFSVASVKFWRVKLWRNKD